MKKCFFLDVRANLALCSVFSLFVLIFNAAIAPSLASADETELVLVSFLNGEEVLKSELIPTKEIFLRETAGKSREERAIWLQAYIGEQLANRLLEKMLPTLNGKAELAIKGKVQAQFLSALRKVDLLEKKRIKQELEKLEKEIIEGIEGELPDRERRVAQLKQLLAIYKETAQFEKEYPAEQDKLRRAIARSFLKDWLVHKTLYKKYGGRVALRTSGAFPLDAMRDFLKEQKTKGEFRIANKKIERAMWLFFLDWNRHLFLPEEEGKLAMENPAWFVQ